MTLQDRLDKHSIPEPNSGCVLWTGALKYNGYGAIRIDGRTQYAHRVAWQIANGPIPAGKCVCHKCDVPSCINPDHLWLGSVQENMADKVSKGRAPKGERHYGARLTDDQVREIRASSASLNVAGKQYGVAFQTIAKIRNHQAWTHVGGEA